MLQVLAGVYAICAFAALLLLGQGAVWLLSFGQHERNPVYLLFRFLTRPVVALVRHISPRAIADRHVPVVAFLLLFWICLGFALGLPRLAGRG